MLILRFPFFFRFWVGHAGFSQPADGVPARFCIVPALRKKLCGSRLQTKARSMWWSLLSVFPHTFLPTFPIASASFGELLVDCVCRAPRKLRAFSKWRKPFSKLLKAS